MTQALCMTQVGRREEKTEEGQPRDESWKMAVITYNMKGGRFLSSFISSLLIKLIMRRWERVRGSLNGVSGWWETEERLTWWRCSLAGVLCCKKAELSNAREAFCAMAEG